jgi:hypothetical protein
LGEHLLCKQRVMGSSPFTSTGMEVRFGVRMARKSLANPLAESSGARQVGFATCRTKRWLTELQKTKLAKMKIAVDGRR